MYYKGQTILMSYVDEGCDDIKEMPCIYLGTNPKGDVLSYYGKEHTEIMESGKIDIRAIGDPKVDGGVYWGKFRTNSMAGVMTKDNVLNNFKDWNKELSKVKGMLTRRNKNK